MFEEDYDLNRKKFIYQLKHNPNNRKQFCGGWNVSDDGSMCAIPVGLEAFYPIETLQGFAGAEEYGDVFYDLIRYKLGVNPAEIYELNDKNMSFEQVAAGLEKKWF